MKRPLNLRRHAVLLPICLLMLAPIYILFVNAFKTEEDIRASAFSLPFDRLTVSNIIEAVQGVGGFEVLTAYRTSFIITVSTVVGTIVVSSMISYVLARRTGRYFQVVYLLIVAGLLIPPQVILLPVVQILSALNLMFTLPGLVLFNIAGALPLGVFIYTSFIRKVPLELDEAAMVDGAGPFRIFTRVIVPLVLPVTLTVSIFIAIFAWNDFVGPLVILGPTGTQTVTTGVFQAIGQYSVDFERVYSSLWLASAPMLMLYVVVQRWFVSGLTEGGVKG